VHRSAFIHSNQGQTLSVALLGTGTPDVSMKRFGPSILVEAGGQKFLFDCGRGAVMRLSQLHMSLEEVNRLFLTHLHSDHTVGIPDLWLTGWIFDRKEPFYVWGPAGTRNMMSHLEKAYAFDIHIRRDVDEKIPGRGVIVVARDIRQGVVFESNGVKITAFDVDHGPVKPALGYRIDCGGHSVVLSGDTRPSENLIRFAKGTDLLVHEVYYVDEETLRSSPEERIIMRHHTTPEQAGEVFSRVQPKLALYSHIGRRDVADAKLIELTHKTYSGPLEVGEDLMTIEVGEKIEVRRLEE
jgi:ribonuclease Z